MLDLDAITAPHAPLEGKTVLLTAPQDSAERMAEWVQQHGGQALIAPLIARVPLPVSAQHAQIFDRLAEYRWIVFTSGGAVERFFDEIETRGVNREVAGSIIVAIGGRTQRRIEQRGYRVALIAGDNSGEGVVAAISAYGLAAADRVLLPCAGNARQHVFEELQRRGAHVEVLPLYTIAPQVPPNLNLVFSLLRGDKIDVISFTSPSVVRQFYRLFPIADWHELARPPLLCALGATTAAALEESGIRPDVVPPQADAERMLAAVAVAVAAHESSPSTRPLP
ncbi:MAG: uroporphyrinogen-III synthase [bacterium]